MTTKEMIAVMQAFEDGAEIEVSFDNIHWEVIHDPSWAWNISNYRVKHPKQKLWYWEFKYAGNWLMSNTRHTEEDFKELGHKQYKKLEAFGFIEE